MITTTHAVLNALVAQRANRRPEGFLADASTRRAFIAGGIAPDIALHVLSSAALAYYPLVDGRGIRDAHQLAMDDLFFNSPWWIIGHNLLHAPLILLPLFVLGATIGSQRGRWLKSFAAGAALHTAVDALTHHDDGPLLAFPFSWSLRFSSPVSYWDPEYFGRIVRPIDLAITVAGGIWFAAHWRQRHRTR